MNLTQTHTRSLIFAFTKGCINLTELEIELMGHGFSRDDVSDWMRRYSNHLAGHASVTTIVTGL